MKQDSYAGKATHITLTGLWINTALTVLKFIAGFLGNSTALIADAVHSLTDFVTDFVVIAGVRIAEKPVDETHRYGHGKIETLVTSFVAIMLMVAAAGIFYSGVTTIVGVIEGEQPRTPGIIALIVTGIAIAAKEGIFRYTLKRGKEIGSRSVIANAHHHRSDVLSSMGAFLGIGGAIVLGEEWAILDPLAGIIVSVFIFITAVKLITSTVHELVETSLGSETEQHIRDIADEVSGVSNPHNIRTRRVGRNIVMDIHINVRNDITVKEAHDIAHEVENKLKDIYGEGSIINVHIEPDQLPE